jgi:hydroxyacyl-ACP dehydratase HTD2-like protein with hotdog domain
MSLAPTVGMAIPERQHDCDEVQQMLYNASLWNGHRIHFDMPYATEVEGYPGLVVAGPLMGDWLHQVVDEWLGDAGMITSIEYSNRIAAYVGETVTAGGIVMDYDEATGQVTLEVFVKNASDEVLTPGVITAQLTVMS